MAWTSFITMETTPCSSSPHENGDVLPLKVASSTALQVHLYYHSQYPSDRPPLTFPPGDYVAEELCIKAAKECGKYFSTFCLEMFSFLLTLRWFAILLLNWRCKANRKNVLCPISIMQAACLNHHTRLKLYRVI